MRQSVAAGRGGSLHDVRRPAPSTNQQGVAETVVRDGAAAGEGGQRRDAELLGDPAGKGAATADDIAADRRVLGEVHRHPRRVAGISPRAQGGRVQPPASHSSAVAAAAATAAAATASLPPTA